MRELSTVEQPEAASVAGDTDDGASSNRRLIIQRLIDERRRSHDALAGGGEPFDGSSDASFMLALPAAKDLSALGTTEPCESPPRAVARPPPAVVVAALGRRRLRLAER